MATTRAPSPVTRLVRSYVRYTPGTIGKAGIVDKFLNARLRNFPVNAATTLRTGDRISVDTKDIVQRYLYQFGVWEPCLTAWLRRTLKQGDVFVDVGANIGYFSLIAARIVGPSGAVVSIEASPAAYSALCANLAANHADNARPVPYAVAESVRSLTFYEPKSGIHSVTTSVRMNDELAPVFETTAKPLPDLLTAAELSGARVIKIDIEGGEYSALRGLVPALATSRPDLELVVEVSASMLAKQSHTIAETVALLGDLGFHTYQLINSYRPSSYLAAPSSPKRVREPVTTDADLVFSRVDQDSL